jgi:hypothetical protein
VLGDDDDDADADERLSSTSIPSPSVAASASSSHVDGRYVVFVRRRIVYRSRRGALLRG